MPKKLPEEVKLKALELYLSGDNTAETISDEVSKEFNVKVATSTVYSWIKSDGWKDTKLATRADAIVKVQESETQRYARLQEEHLNEYESLRHKAVMEGLINLQFIQDVMSVLIDEIQDPDLLQRVAFKLKTLVQKDGDG